MGHHRRHRRDRDPASLLNIVGIKEAAGLNVFLALVDFATQLLLVVLGFFLIFNWQVLTSNVHWGMAPTWSSFALAIPVAMIAYTGIETVSNLAEEARDPVRSIPSAIKWVAIAVFAIYFTLPFVALSALPVYQDAAGNWVTKLGLGPEQGGFKNDPVLGLVENLDLHGIVLSRREDLRRRPRGDDSLHRDQRRRDRRVADHVLDVDLPAAAGGLSPAASEAEDAVALARRLRRRGADPVRARRQGRLPRPDVRVRGDALVHDRARLGDRAAREAAEGRGAAWRAWPNMRIARDQLAGVRDPRRPRRPAIAFLVVIVQDAPTRYAGLGWLVLGFVFYPLVPPSARAVAARDRACADRDRPGAALEYRNILVPLAPGPSARRRSTSRAGSRASAAPASLRSP